MRTEPASGIRGWLSRRSRSWTFWRSLVQAVSLGLVIVVALRQTVQPGAPSVEAYCPFGAVESFWANVTTGTYLRHVSPWASVALLAVAASAVLLGRVFCGWVCPLGTVQDLLASLARRLGGRERLLPLTLPRWMDRSLRWAKVAVLAWVIWASIGAYVPPLAPFCPFRTLFEWPALSLLGAGVLLTVATGSLLVERFWCRYLCPLGALLALVNAISPVRPRVNPARCVGCGRCARACPMGIDPLADGTEHPECIRCMSCVQACRRPGAMAVGPRDASPSPTDQSSHA